MSPSRRQQCCTLLWRSLNKEFTKEAFGFQHEDPIQLSLPQWRWMEGGFYVSFRFVVATALLTWLACEIPFEMRRMGEKSPLLWFAFATQWAFILYTFTAILFAAFAIYYQLKKDQSAEVVGYRTIWLLFELSANTILTTSGIYWIAMWDREYAYFFKLSSKLKHSIPAVLILVEVGLNGVPVRLLHGLYALALGVLYGLFSLCYWLSGAAGFTGNGVIYPILNWNLPGQAVGACFLGLLFSSLIQVLLYLLSFARTYASYLIGGRGVQTFRSLCPEAEGDEGHLIARDPPDIAERGGVGGGGGICGAPKSYAALE